MVCIQEKEREPLFCSIFCGCSLDVAVASIGDRVFKIIVITSIIHLGGQDFDQRVINYFIE